MVKNILREPVLLLFQTLGAASPDVVGGPFFWRRDDGLLIPTSMVSPQSVAGFSGEWPTSVLALDQPSDVTNLLALRDLWTRNSLDLYENIDLAPTVETRDFGSVSGNLYSNIVKTGFITRERLWFLRKRCWTEEQPQAFRLGFGF